MVQLCERENETYASLNLNLREFLAIDGNRLIGFSGKVLDKLLTRPDKRRYCVIHSVYTILIFPSNLIMETFFIELNRCFLVGERMFGEKTLNGSWTGNLGI